MLERMPLLFMALSSLAGCDPDYDWGEPPTTQLGDSDCFATEQPATLCGWVVGQDAVLVGEVENVFAVHTPIRVTRPDGEIAIIDEEVACQSPAVGLQLLLQVEEVLYQRDELSLSTEDTLLLNVGAGMMQHWNTSPADWSAETGEILSWHRSEPPFAQGDFLGLAVNIDARGAFNLGFDPFFTAGPGGVVFHESGEPCGRFSGSPPDAAGMAYTQFRLQTGGCDLASVDAEEARIQRLRRTGLDAPFSQGAICFDSPESP